MRLRVVRGRVWNRPWLVLLVLFAPLDFFVLFLNSEVYLLYKNKTLVCFCTVKKWGRVRELGTAYTKPVFRRKGYFKKLAVHVTKHYKTLYVITYDYLVRAAKKAGFKIVKKPPLMLWLRCALANVFFRPFVGEYAVLKYTRK